MGNSNSNNKFTNLEEVVKEKSLFSFKVKLVEISVENENEKRGKKIDNYKMKLKLYPSTLTLKNDNFKLDFSYYNIFSWYTSKNFFSFKTVEKDSYNFLTEGNLVAADISRSLKGICSDLAKKQKNIT